MKNIKLKGIFLVVAALFLCLRIRLNKNIDMYSIQFLQEDFRAVNLANYSGDSSALQYYVPESEDTVKCFTKGPISLEGGHKYDVEIQYAGSDRSTVFKVFAADYISSDNSGGKVLINQDLSADRSSLKISFDLDQNVDSLFINFETADDRFQLGRINIRSETPVFNDRFFLAACVFMAAVISVFLLNISFSRAKGLQISGRDIDGRKAAFVILFVFSIAVFAASLPILDGGILYGHDTDFHMARIEGIARGLESGQFPVRIHGGILNDYGYPNSLFYPELLLYFPAVLRVLNISVYTAFKAYIIFINILTVVLSYIAFKKLFDDRFVAVALAVAYLLLPYRLICGYYRSAIGEFTAMTFIPMLLYGLYAVVYGNKKDWIYLTAGASGILQSHILTTEICAVFSALFLIFGVKKLFGKEKRLVSLLLAAVFSVLLNRWLLVPMIIMMMQLGLTVFSRSSLTSGFASSNISYLFSLIKIDSQSLKGPYPLGVVVVFGIIAFIAARIIYDENKDTNIGKFADNSLICFLIFTVMATSVFPWSAVENIPLAGKILGSIQFPYRVLSVSQTLGVALAGVAVLTICKNNSARSGAGIVIICAAIMSSFLITDTIVGEGRRRIENKSSYTNSLDNQLSIGQGEYLIAGNDLEYMVAHPPVLESENSSFAVTGYKRWGTRIDFEYTMDITGTNDDVIVLPVTYIPNYSVTIDGQPVQIFKTDDARVAFKADKPDGNVNVRYQEPLTFRLCEAVSLLSLSALISLPGLKNFFNRHRRNPKV